MKPICSLCFILLASLAMPSADAAHPNIVALKDTSGDFLFFQELLAAYRNDPSFLLYQGVGYLLGASVMLGAAGAVAGLVNLVHQHSC